MSRKQIKRILALIKAEVEHDRDFNLDLPERFKESFEGQKHFKGWINYHVTWGVSKKDAWKVVPLKKSLEQEWHDELEKVIPVITPEGEIVSEKEWAKRLTSTQTQKS
jgi:hypothetical protein